MSTRVVLFTAFGCWLLRNGPDSISPASPNFFFFSPPRLTVCPTGSLCEGVITHLALFPTHLHLKKALVVSDSHFFLLIRLRLLYWAYASDCTSRTFASAFLVPTEYSSFESALWCTKYSRLAVNIQLLISLRLRSAFKPLNCWFNTLPVAAARVISFSRIFLHLHCRRRSAARSQPSCYLAYLTLTRLSTFL